MEGLASRRLAASLVWTGRDWFVTRGPFDWAKSPSDLNLSLPPYLCCPFFLLCILTLAQQLGKGAQVEADTEQKGWRSLLLKLCNDWQGRSSSSYFSLSILPLGLQRFTKPQIHIHTNTPTHHSPNRDTQPKPLSPLSFPLSVSLSHTRTRTHALSLSLSPPLPPSCYLWLGETSRSTNINYKGQRKVRRRQLSKGVVMLFQVNCKCVRGKISPQWFLSAWLMGTGADSLPELLQLCLKPHTFQQEPSAWAFLNSLFISFIKGIRQVGICMKRILWEYCLQGRYFHDFPHPGALSVSLLFLSLFC